MSPQEMNEVEHLRQQLQNAQERSENTALPKFLELCHKLFSEPLRVQTNRSLTTKGSITSPRGKKHPTHLRPWHDFPQLQLHYFDRAYSMLCPEESSPHKLFSSRIALEDLGRTLCRRPLASEKDLESYERFAVEEKVKDVMEQLMKIPEAQSLLNECDEVEFENHLNTLSDNAEEVLERQKRSRTDQACVFRNIHGDRSLLFVREYKAAHKLSVEYLRAGLRPMNLREEVVQRPMIPQDVGEKLNYNADRLVAAAVTQTFEYMIENGLEFSCISTGPAEVYLRVIEDDPTTVYYYLAEPKMDVGEDSELGFRYPFTAIARMLGFGLMALHSRVRNQAWRDMASQSLYRWNEDFEDVIHSIPNDERLATPPASLYKPPAYPVHQRSPYLLRIRPLALTNDDGPVKSFISESSSDGSTGNPHGHNSAVETPSRATGNTKRKRNSTQGTSGRSTTRQYCTQKCLLGLKRRRVLDLACPNYHLHHQKSASRLHPINVASFHQLVQAQLTADMDHHCDALGRQGARGALFKITLASHGYTFVGKGTVEAFVQDLRHEGEIYDRWADVQGSLVPVCLGNMDLNRTYYLDVGVRIVHMLYMAWGGESLYHQTPSVPSATLEREKQRSLKEFARSVLHGDIREENLLWNVETQRVMLIDFERSVLYQRKRKVEQSHILDEVSPNAKQLRLITPLQQRNEKAVQQIAANVLTT
jgi:Phosphotransferase enzyme family